MENDLQYGRLDQWRGTSRIDEAQAREMASRLELRGQSEDEVAARSAYLDLLGMGPGERVLDVGCGSGVVTRDLARRVEPDGMAVGLDHSPALLAVARELADQAALGDRVEFRDGDARALPFADAEFDAVVAVTALSHVPDGESAIPEMVRVARPGGRIGIFEQDSDSFIVSHPDRALTRRIIAASSDHGAVNGWLGRTLPDLLAEAGLQDVRVRAFTPLERDPSGFYASLAERRAERAVQVEAISAEEQRRWLSALHAEQVAGRLLAGLVHIFAWGIRPLVMYVVEDAEAVAAEPATVLEEPLVAVAEPEEPLTGTVPTPTEPVVPVKTRA